MAFSPLVLSLTAITLLIGIISQAIFVGVVYGGLRADVRNLLVTVQTLAGLPKLSADVDTLKEDVKYATGWLRDFGAEWSDVKARLTILEKTKASRDDLPAVRPAACSHPEIA